MSGSESVKARIDGLAESIDKSPNRDAWFGSVLSVVRGVRGPDDQITRSLEMALDDWMMKGGRGPGAVKSDTMSRTFRGAILGLKDDVESGLLHLRGVIRREVEESFLVQASQLLKQEYKDPAAMLTGAVLEDALRELCRRHGVSEADGIEKMNVPLKKAGAYGLTQQQQVTAWTAIRNKADHGHFQEYSTEEVSLMHQGVATFVASYLGI